MHFQVLYKLVTVFFTKIYDLSMFSSAAASTSEK